MRKVTSLPGIVSAYGTIQPPLTWTTGPATSGLALPATNPGISSAWIAVRFPARTGRSPVPTSETTVKHIRQSAADTRVGRPSGMMEE